MAAIATATRGWPLAVRLAAEIRGRGGPLDHAAIVDRLLDREGVLFEYLAEEVLATASDGRARAARARRARPVRRHTPADVDRARRPRAPAPGPRAAPACSSSAIRRRRTATAPRSSAASSPAGHSPRHRPSSCGASSRRCASAATPNRRSRRACDSATPRSRARSSWRSPDPTCSAARWTMPSRSPRPTVTTPCSPSCAATSTTCAVRGTTPSPPTPRRPRLGDPTATRLARKRATLLYLRGRLDEADATCAAARVDGSDPAEESQGPVVAGRRALDARRRGRVPRVPRAGPGARDGGR